MDDWTAYLGRKPAEGQGGTTRRGARLTTTCISEHRHYGIGRSRIGHLGNLAVASRSNAASAVRPLIGSGNLAARSELLMHTDRKEPGGTENRRGQVAHTIEEIARLAAFNCAGEERGKWLIARFDQ